MDHSVSGDEHIPVLLQEVLTHLVGRAPTPEDPDGESEIFVDATFGRGGHSRKLLERLSAQGQLLGLDRDPEALAEARRLAEHDPRFSFCQARFSELKDVLREFAACSWMSVCRRPSSIVQNEASASLPKVH